MEGERHERAPGCGRNGCGSGLGAFGMVWGKFGWDTFTSIFIGGIIMGFLIELIVRLALRASTQEPSMARRS